MVSGLIPINDSLPRPRARSASMCRSVAQTHYLKNESKIPLETVGKGSLYEGLPALWVVLACIQREFPINAGENFFPVVGFLWKSYCLGQVVSDCGWGVRFLDDAEMDLTNMEIFLSLLLILNLFLLRKYYLAVKVLRLEFTMFIRHTSIQVDEMVSAARESIVEQVQIRFPDKTEQEAEMFVPDDITEAKRIYRETIEDAQKTLIRNNVKALTNLDVEFGLSDNFK